MQLLGLVALAWLAMVNVVAKTTMMSTSPPSMVNHDPHLLVPRREELVTGRVSVLNGTAGALSLAYYLTAPADLHYAVVRTGRNALSAEEIKIAATGNATAMDVIVAATIVSKTAQRLQWPVKDLTPNTTYDVYFVAEVSHSNGVFGTIVSVNGTTTHPEAPRVLVLDSWAQHGSTTMAALDLNLTFRGLVHYVVVPVEASQNLSALDIWHNVTGATQTAKVPSANHTLLNITGLAPFTTYDIWLVSEVAGSGGVLGAVGYVENAFTTFAAAPKLAQFLCAPVDASTTSIGLQFRLDFPLQTLESFNIKESHRPLRYHVHYVATTETDVAAFVDASAIKGATNVTGTRQAGRFSLSLPGDAADTALVMTATATKIDFAATIAQLPVGASHLVAIVVETVDSGGVFSNALAVGSCATHATAPRVLSVSAEARNKTTDVLMAKVTIERPGDVHFVYGAPSAFRLVPLAQHGSLIPYVREYNASFTHAVVRNGGRIDGNGTRVEHEDQSRGEELTVFFALENLNATTPYGLLVFAETTGSGGVLSPPHTNVEARTNGPAGDVVYTTVAPVLGSTSELRVHASLTQAQDKLVVCYSVGDDVGDTLCQDHAPPVVTIGNLSANALVSITLFAETPRGVESARTKLPPLRTHDDAPLITESALNHRPGHAMVLDATVRLSRPGFVHYAVIPTADVDMWNTPAQTALLASKQRVVVPSQRPRLPLELADLSPNTSYTLLLLPEAAYETNRTGVYGAVKMHNLTTYALAPSILQSTVVPLNATVDAIVVTANLSSPGRVHYMVSDVDFADPAVLRAAEIVPPFVRRGSFDVTDAVLEARNTTVGGVNVTSWHPLEIYNHNVTLGSLASGTLYHVYLATETFESFGVFGTALPPPHVVTTHAPAPVVEALTVRATPDSASAIDVAIVVSRFGDLHYILVHRGPYVVQDVRNASELSSNETTPVSALETVALTPTDVKAASVDRLGEGVVENGTISFSREDWTKHTGTTTKSFKALRPGSTYELCIVAETDASEGVFDAVTCAVVKTHADFTNVSAAFDTLAAAPVAATTDSVALTWDMACLGDCHRTPYFVLVSEALGGRPEFTSNGFGRDTRFDTIAPGQYGVVAAGQMALRGRETNATDAHPDAVVATFEATVTELGPHERYFAFFAAETDGSAGVFSRVNANANASASTVSVTTHAAPPRLRSYRARPTYGNTTAIDVVVDIACTTCTNATLHTVVTLRDCSRANPRCVLLTGAHDVPLPSHEAKDFVVLLESALLLAPNTSYDVYIATETAGSGGVVSSWRKAQVTTHPLAPRVVAAEARPKAASTTEIALSFTLSAPGVVHFMLSDDREHVEVASVYNISAKKPPGSNDDWHKYGYERVKWRRSVPATGSHVEVMQQLVQNTSYSVHLVVEASGDAGIYGPIHVVRNVSTFAHAPLLLTHEAAPTPASTNRLRLQYTLNAVGLVHVLVTMAAKWQPTAPAPVFGNVLGLDQTVVAQLSLTGDAAAVDLAVPLANQSYSILLVTETLDSHGVYGAVARLDGIRSSDVAPVVERVNVSATDARNDALTVTVALGTVGVVHYSPALPQQPPSLDRVRQHVIDNVSALEGTFVIDGLNQGTVYDVYLQTETLGSQGVLGPLLKIDGTVATHGPPPPILEEVDCSLAPLACDALGREPCWAVPHTCGACLEGFVGDDGAANTPCTRFSPESKPRKAKKSIGIKISGVKAHVEPKPEPADVCPEHAHASVANPSACDCDDGYVLDGGVCVPLCPPHSFLSAPGRCQCDPGFVLDAGGAACVLDGAFSGGVVGVTSA
ncbi:hypothetical protein ACHHYP_08387 [Achlya hypogyna]|uniref:Fibronectin type-III domain-containing protein n=1 Tax=Achlya hypogyna TaxID=1202772 RepID=A0A1V9ZL88_ACHHY|nr:hypothetical protein ACHHYP_08387 [Achlya hypogyna]